MSDGTRIVRRRWTAGEDETLRREYETTTAPELGLRLNRTAVSIHGRARVLGIVKRTERHDAWSEDELAILRAGYATEGTSSVAAKLGRSALSVRQQAAVIGLVSARTQAARSVVHGYFTEIRTQEQAYLLGLLAADGNVAEPKPRIVIGLQAKDAHLVGWVRDRLAPAAGMSVRPDGYTVLQVTSERMVADLAPHGIVPRKSRTLPWPHHLGALLRPYLLGYFDGDGFAYVARNHGTDRPGWGVCSGSLEFIEDLKAYVEQETGVRLWKIQHRKGADLWQTATTGRNAWIIGEWLRLEGLGLERKRFPAHLTEWCRRTAAFPVTRTRRCERDE